MNPLPEYLHLHLEDDLRLRRVVVWYDPGREFELFVSGLERKPAGALPQVTLGRVDAGLAVYDGSFFALRLEIEPLVEPARPEPLLIYVPGEKPSERGSPLKELECAGKLYQPALGKVAKLLLKRTYTEGTIDEMFRGRNPGYDDIRQLLEPGQEGESSILKLVLGEMDAPSMLARWLFDPSTDTAIENKGGRGEFTKLVALKCGLTLPETGRLADHRDQLCRFLLLNEFRQDLRCPEPSTIAMVPRATLKDQRDFICRVLDRLRENYAGFFEMVADSVEQEFSLATAGIKAADLGRIDTFRFEEKAMLAHIGESIAAGRYEDAGRMTLEHRHSFWAEHDLSRRQIQWELCATLAELGSEALRVAGELKAIGGGARVFVERYTAEQGWHRMDALHRRLESHIARMQEEPEAEHAVAMVRTKTEEVLLAMADGFGAALEDDKWTVNRTLQQTQIYPQKVAPLPGNVAWFHVDAMRFEMAAELARQLPEAAEVEVTPAIAVLPSITPLCMAALLPCASASYAVIEHEGKAAVRIGSAVIGDVNDRMNYLKAQIPDAGDITLEKLLQSSTTKLQGLTAGVRLLVVRSQEIDSLGEKHELLARQLMDTVIGNLARAVRRLADRGFERFVITADHGHQFSSRKENDMKVVNLEMDAELVSPAPVRLRVVLVHKNEEVGFAGMAHGAEFNSEDKVLTLAPGQRANVVLVLTRDGIASTVDSGGMVGLYRIEVSVSGGTGKLKMAGGAAGSMKESFTRAFSYLQSNKTALGDPTRLRHERLSRRVHRSAGQPHRRRHWRGFSRRVLFHLEEGVTAGGTDHSGRPEYPGKYQVPPLAQ